jgi:hypothetical protein
MDKSQHKGVHAAVIEADYTKLATHSGIEEGTAPHLRPAGDKLEAALQLALNADPNSDLARQVRELLDHEKLFYVVGKWPPTSGVQLSSSPSVAARYCRLCGKPNP